MKFCSLVSGSSGNAALISAGSTNILIDCGISAKRTEKLLKEAGIEGGLDAIDAVLLTHEHSDHIKGVKRIMSAYGIPVYGSMGTLRALADVTRDEYFNYAGHALMEPVRADFEVSIGDISFTPFNIYHDAAEPLSYRIELNDTNAVNDTNSANETSSDKSFVIMTDCGHYDDYICDHLTGLDALILEAYHDLRMLANGPYPMSLKRRILSDTGHLSNVDAGDLLSRIYAPRLKTVRLGHLSRENNTPELAVRTVVDRFKALRGTEAAGNISVDAASPDMPTYLIQE